ncbi:MAG: YajG family lipoprotein [Gammaproteobacteria bacterium]
MLRKSLIAILIIIPALSGCAFTTATTPLTYLPQKNVAALPNAKNVVVNVVVENHKKHKRIGSKKNGFGMSMASIYAKEPISKIVRGAIEEELVARGFGTGSHGPVMVNATVKEFHNTFHLGLLEGEAVAKLNMAVAVMTKRGKEVFSKDIMATGKTGSMLASGYNAGIAMDRALSAGIKSLFDDPAFIRALFTADR